MLSRIGRKKKKCLRCGVRTSVLSYYSYIQETKTYCYMEKKDVSELIKESIQTCKQVTIKMKSGFGREISISFHPYIYGHDIFQFEFVWGYYPVAHVFYKILTENISSISISEITYTVLPDAIYQYSLEEEHFAVLVGFHNIFSESSIPSSPENKPPEQSAS